MLELICTESTTVQPETEMSNLQRRQNNNNINNTSYTASPSLLPFPSLERKRPRVMTALRKKEANKIVIAKEITCRTIFLRVILSADKETFDLD
ncbi:hypothetical protein DID88_008608 [Monilinia fructigena]|uniref:Uncharacterized protein n=1 Tax=Monilinia fructigena TaxID=38457 RepID=A0A395J8A6_9HELO|nr:hypothetical protein DID88_008608 [Monilinia fructigena]